MTVIQFLKKALDRGGTTYQYLSYCATTAKRKKDGRKKDSGEHTEITFTTSAAGPMDVFYPKTGNVVGVILWIPRKDFEELSEKV